MTLAISQGWSHKPCFKVWPITVLKLPSQYFPWGGGGAAATYIGAAATYIGAEATYMGAAATYMGGGWGKVEINAISAQHSWNWALLELGLSLAIYLALS